MNANVLKNRHDVLVLFEVANGNPNGDPDAGNMPRIDPNTNKGLVSDVCLKRKVRNFVAMFPPPRAGADGNGFGIFIEQAAVLNDRISDAIKKAEPTAKAEKASSIQKAEAAKNWLCREFYDIRTFGGVLSTGEDVMKGSAHGQVRGPVQFTFAQSLDPITPLEISITRCAVTKAEDAQKERTMGNKHIVAYALYLAKAYVSPAFARHTGFADADLKVLFEALSNMFEHDHSAARGEMTVRLLYDFEHVGTQGPANAEQNAREAMLGCAPAHKLFETTTARLKEGKQFPESFADYSVACDFSTQRFPGVKLNRIIDPLA
jgi:CRISPR-associated protein Csd2